MLSEEDYTSYPHAKYSLPTESQVAQYVRSEPKSRKSIVKDFVQMRSGKQGIKEVIEEILSRKTTVQDGKAVWID